MRQHEPPHHRCVGDQESPWRTRGLGLALIGLLLCGGIWFAAGPRGDPRWRKLPESEVRELFAGSTVEGYHELHRYNFKSYSHPSGSFKSEQDDKQSLREGQWWTTANGNICIRWQDEGRDLCRAMMVDDAGHYRKVQEGWRGRVVVTFTRFAKGNLYGL